MYVHAIYICEHTHGNVRHAHTTARTHTRVETRTCAQTYTYTHMTLHIHSIFADMLVICAKRPATYCCKQKRLVHASKLSQCRVSAHVQRQKHAGRQIMWSAQLHRKVQRGSHTSKRALPHHLELKALTPPAPEETLQGRVSHWDGQNLAAV